MITLTIYDADRSDTQPTRCRWEVVPDSREKKQVLGGTKTGNGAWALAWVDTIMELPQAGGEHRNISSKNSELPVTI
jgi:chromatin structure-remodeling complex protein RSC7